ncbi:MAG: HlyC/CorC family transporter [Phycisphaerae bacterium]|nr:HlyC/CorC family transporter [Phycisphaerae bacterium]
MDPLLWVVAVLTALSCFFALASYSLRAYRRVELEESFNGSDGKRRLARLERHLPQLRLTVSFCRSAANLALVVALVYAFDAATADGGRLLAAGATALALLAVFGVGIPHAWASHVGQRVLTATLDVLLALRYALYPIVWVMQVFDVPIRRLAGVAEPDAHAQDTAAKQEILHAATEGQAEGAVHREEVRMIESVMEFAETRTDEIMTPRTDIFALPIHTPWPEAVEKIVAAGHTRVPLYEDNIDHIVGVLYAKDMLRHIGEQSPPALRRLMRKCYFVPESKTLDALLGELKSRKVHQAIVLDEYGGTAGLITMEDVLEEIVGDISDEYDQTAPALMRRIDAATAEVDGRMYIDDLNDALGLTIPEDADYDTVAGLVFSELGYVPTAGEQLDAHGVRFTVLAADERRITRLRIERPKPQDAAPD